MQVVTQVLGAARVCVEGAWVLLPCEKSTALLAFVACHAAGVSRAELSALFWPDTGEARARANLRQLLSRIRGADWSDVLEIGEHHLSLRGSSDVGGFWTALEAGDLKDAVRLGGHDLLSGFSLPDALEFENWLDAERQSIGNAWRDASLRLARISEPRAALRLLKDVLRRDSLCEEALQTALRVMVEATRLETLELAQVFKRSLKSALNLEPSATTLALLDLGTVSHASQSTSLPMPGTPLVGREAELAALKDLFAGDARLVSLVAQGGMGKTRVALAFAHTQPNAVFVNLASAATSAQALSAVLAALGIKSGTDDRAELLQFLRNFAGLLLLDNLEAHVETFAALLHQTLEQSPKLRVLVTSREPLGLQAETVYPLAGLTPGDAARLFTQSARRSDARFAVLDGDGLLIDQIAQRLEGMPLAIELAASWVRSISLPQLQVELQRGLDVLTSQWRDTPARHRSLRVVLEQSLQQLPAGGRSSLEQLSVFVGGFTLAAAKAVTGITLVNLERLVSLALVKRTNERYSLHELVRQYASEHLAAQPAPMRGALGRHAAYFASAMPAMPRRTAQTVSTLELELPNLRLAWETASRTGNATWLGTLMPVLDDLYDVRGRTTEALEVFAAATAVITEPALLGGLLMRVGSYAMRIGDTTHATDALTRSLEYPSSSQGLVSTLHQLGQLASRRGQWLDAAGYFERGRCVSLDRGDHGGLAQCLNGLGINAKLQGLYAEARAYLTASLEVCERSANPEGTATALTNLGNVLEAEGDLSSAALIYTRCLTHFEALGHKRALGVILNNLGVIQTKLGDVAIARSHFELAISLKRELGDGRGVSLSLTSYAELLTSESKLEAARVMLLDAIRVALDADAAPTALIGFASLAQVLSQQGQTHKAAQLLEAVAQHPLTMPSLRLEAEQHLTALRPATLAFEMQQPLALESLLMLAVERVTLT